MKADMKEALCRAFEAPPPVDRERFLKNIPRPQISHVEFMFLQIGHMKAWIWAVSAAIFGTALYGAYFMERNVLWAVSAMMPFIALAVTTENARSVVYGMEELEMACRFSLKSIVMARLGILGIFHAVLICLFLPVCVKNSQFTILQTGVYLTVPYLLTAVSGLAAVRKIRGKESLYVCMGIAAAISCMHIIVNFGNENIIYGMQYFSWWVAALGALIILFIMECRKTMTQTEELVWNLQ